MDLVSQLPALSREFGRGAASAKLELLERIGRIPALGPGARRVLRETLNFMRAHPDDARVRRRVRETIAALPPPPPIAYAFSYGVVRRLVRLVPGHIEIDWDSLDDDATLADTLDLLVTPGESQALESGVLPIHEWFALQRTRHARSDLALLVTLLERSGLPPRVQDHLYERCDLPLRYEGPGPCEVELPAETIHYQRRELDRTRCAIEPMIRAPLDPPERGGQGEIDAALLALCARTLEIYPLIHANPADVRIVDCGSGVRIVLAGVLPEFRSAFESLFFFLIAKNDVPIAYGPAGVFLGCCEMGINLFPEFRGGEVRFLYAQFMRVLHHLLGVECFFVTRYGMGEENEDAIESGAFWFYRRLGFRATNPDVEAIAQAEEARMAKRPRHRSSRRTLRRLSRTEALLDLSGGRCRPLDLGRLGMAESRWIAARHGGDRAAATDRSAARIGRMLGLPPGGVALRAMAPALSMIPNLARWSRAERGALAGIIRAKQVRSEIAAARRFQAHARLSAALRALAER